MFLWIKTGFDISTLSFDAMDCVHQVRTPKTVAFYAKTQFTTLEDSFFDADADGYTMFQGIIVNSSEQISRYAAPDLPDLIKTALAKGRQNMLGDFHGQFCAISYSASADALIAVTNVTNGMRVYYYQDRDTAIVSTSLKLITNAMKHLDIVPQCDEIAARMVLSYGYTLEDFTTIQGVKQLGAGNCLSLCGNSLEVRSYHRFNNETLYTDPKSALQELDRLFQKAVSTAYEKDLEKGRKHIAFLSGGLDSRIGVWAAYKQGYRDLTCLNFSQPGYADELIARRICKDLDLGFQFFSLAKGDYLLHLDDNLVYNDGQIILHGAAHLYQAIQQVDTGTYGIFHSGQIGDFILGSNLEAPYQKAVDLNKGAYSQRLLDSFLPEIGYIRERYPNHELFYFYNRCFNAVMNGDYACSTNSLSLSPFLEPQFAQFGMNISPKLRFHNQLYIEWFKRYYPEAASYRWEKTGTNLYTPQALTALRMLGIRGISKVYRTIAQKPPSRSMNPFDLWYEQNHDLRAKYGHQTELMDTLGGQISPELKTDMLRMLQNGNFSELLQVYTVLRGLTYLLQ
ncbi:MAG: hypothetical protein CVU48_00650 [Candidatus Cloacimonetes bacterium HGW-Cloacimonetes-1]|jgi:asparagine synthase (glutamine-hydrolysing)|nr:MAG: hypothetical protein CVU48_00650 [Candidatus Cloacimonetes bacterium HGW-Cloacimonetes-1]